MKSIDSIETYAYGTSKDPVIAGYGSGKTDSLFNLISQQPDIDQTIYILKILMKQNINFQLINEKVQA